MCQGDFFHVLSLFLRKFGVFAVILPFFFNVFHVVAPESSDMHDYLITHLTGLQNWLQK